MRILPTLVGVFSTTKTREQDLLRYALDGHRRIFSSAVVISIPRSARGAGFGGWKARSSVSKIRIAGVLRLRAPSTVARDKAVRRSAQDDDSVGVLEVPAVSLGSRATRAGWSC
jgi:hypothetical protein